MPTTPWYEKPAAQTLLASLTEQDLQIVRPFSYEPALAFHPATDHADKIFARLHKLCHGVPNRLFRMALHDEARARALAHAQSRPTVEAALASRFGSPDRFRGHRVEDGSATRAFRATFADASAWSEQAA